MAKQNAHWFVKLTGHHPEEAKEVHAIAEWNTITGNITIAKWASGDPMIFDSREDRDQALDNIRQCKGLYR